MVETMLTNDELKRIHNLEFITDIETNGEVTKKIGFSNGKFVILETRDSQSTLMSIPIGNSLYELFK